MTFPDPGSLHLGATVSAPAVVPIVVNAGAAVLPALIAAAASFVALLFKPRELIRTCRRRPLAATLTVVVTLGLILASWAALSAGPAARAGADTLDWNRIALDLLAQRETPTPALHTATAPLPTHAIGLGRDFARAGYDGGPAPRGLSRAWAKEPEGYILTSPAVRGDRVFAASCIVDIAGQFGAVFCLDAATGDLLWKKEADDSGKPFKPFVSSPVVTADGARVIIGQGLHEDRNCALLCFDTATGKLLWQVPSDLHIESSPAVFTHPAHGEVAVVGCGAIEGPDKKPTGHPGYVIAVQVATGKLLWRYDVIDPESSPAVGPDGTVYVGSGFNGSAVLALRSDTDADLAGKPRLLWRTPTPYPATGAVTIAPTRKGPAILLGCGNGDYVSSDPNPKGAVIALDAATGAIRWTFNTPEVVLAEISTRDGVAIAPCKSGEIFALNVEDGARLWSAEVAKRSLVLAGVAFTGDLVYAVSREGKLAVLDARPDASPRILESVTINDESRPGDQGLCMSAPTISNGRLYVGSETGGLRCFVPRNTPTTTPATSPADGGAP